MDDLIPKLSQDEMAPELVAMLRPRVERLGYLGEFFRYTAHQPQALMSFLDFTEYLKRALPNNLTEVVALTVAAFMSNAYERVQHERLSLKLGFGKAWVREVLSIRPEAAVNMSPAEIDVQQLTLAVLERRGHNTQRELKVVIRAIGHQRAIAVLMLVGRYSTHALIVNSLALAPPVKSPLDEDE